MFTAWLSQAPSRYQLAGCWTLTRIKLASLPPTALSAGQTACALLVMASGDENDNLALKEDSPALTMTFGG
jgi:hypothetical protein